MKNQKPKLSKGQIIGIILGIIGIIWVLSDAFAAV